MDEKSTKKMCLRILLTIKSSNESLGNENQKDQKDKFQESVKQQLSWNKEVDGHKKRFCQANKKSPKARFNTKIEINLPALMNHSSQDSQQEILRAQAKNDDTCNNKNKTNTPYNQREFGTKCLL